MESTVRTGGSLYRTHCTAGDHCLEPHCTNGGGGGGGVPIWNHCTEGGHYCMVGSVWSAHPIPPTHPDCGQVDNLKT